MGVSSPVALIGDLPLSEAELDEQYRLLLRYGGVVWSVDGVFGRKLLDEESGR